MGAALTASPGRCSACWNRIGRQQAELDHIGPATLEGGVFPKYALLNEAGLLQNANACDVVSVGAGGQFADPVPLEGQPDTEPDGFRGQATAARLSAI